MILGLCGLIGCGKGTVGEILVNDYGFRADSFAAPLKDAAAAIFGWERSLLEGDTKESREFRETEDLYWSKKLGKPFTPRLALQLLGTEAGRKVFGTNLWSGSLERRYIQSQKNTVVTDVRFPNEIDCIRDMGGFVVHVARGPWPEWYNMAKALNKAHDFKDIEFPPYNFPHASEYSWVGHPGLGALIENDGTLAELKEKIKGLVSTIEL